MSKSALYAGLGQGLMSLGQNVGEAYRMQAIEELRQENLKQNWARQDAIRAEDRQFQKELQQDNRAYQQSQTESDRAWQMERDGAKFEQQKEVAQMGFAREDAKTPTKVVTEERDGKLFEVSYNSAGEQISSKQITKSTLSDTQKELAKIYTDEAEALDESNPAKAKEAREMAIKVLTGNASESDASKALLDWLNGNTEKYKADANTNPAPTPTPPPSPTVTDKSEPTKEERDPYDLSQNTVGLMVNGGIQAAKDAGKGIGNWLSENDVISEVWKNPRAVESLNPQQLTMLIERKGNQPQWQSIIKRAQATLKQYQG